MRTVWKFPVDLFRLGFRDRSVIEMPAGAEVLTVQTQGADMPCLWALVDPEAPKERRAFRVAGTGHPIEGDVRYVGTFQMSAGLLVFHVFEVLGEEE